MIRIIQLTGKYYGCELPPNGYDAIDEIKEFVRDGTPVIVVEHVDDLEELEIYDSVIMVERE